MEAKLAGRFRSFAEETHGSSPLYEKLSLGIAGDPVVSALAAQCRPGQPAPNLLFGAVHYLLLGGAQHPLATFYPSIAGERGAWGEASPGSDSYPAFHDFCLQERSAVEKLVAERLVQTNEVRRCACLLPAFGSAARQAGDRPLALIEIGPSAGLNMLWDRYGYRFLPEDRKDAEGAQPGGAQIGGQDGIAHAPISSAVRYGDRMSPVQIRCSVRGAQWPPLPDPFPYVASRLGIDLHPVDVRDPAAVAWLRALIWPEHRRQVTMLQRAVELAQAQPPRLLAGDALELLPAAFAEAPRDAHLCVYHSHVINQFSPEGAARLAEVLAGEGRGRDLSVISMFYLPGEPHSHVEMLSYRRGQASQALLANCDGHGRWVEWL